MAVLPILQFPNPRLRIKAEPVTVVDDALRAQVKDMYETMYDAKGVGLAATQVDIHKRVFVMDVSDNRSEPQCILNPEIIHREGTQYEAEGCLSVEGAWDKIERAGSVVLRGQTLEMQPIEIAASGLMAVCFQHELDHLDGILFIDHLSRLKQERIRKKITKNASRD